ncbi:MAG: hypothetical protein WAT92_24680 [Saprospiraceae bacterium]
MRIGFLLLIFIWGLKLEAQKLYSRYSSSFFENKEYEILLSNEVDSSYSIFIEMQAKNGSDKGGMIITKSSHASFLDTMKVLRKKYLDWSNIAVENKVKDLDKSIDIDYSPDACYFKPGINTHLDWSSNFVFLFKVIEYKPMVIIWSQKLISESNKLITNEGYYLTFKSLAEMDKFISLLNIDKIKSYLSKPPTKDIFKN